MNTKNPSTLKLFQPIEAVHLAFATNLLLGCLRSGGNTVDDLRKYLENEDFQRQRYPNETVKALLEFVETHPREDVQEAIDYYKEWELLPYEEKQRIKASRGKFFQEKTMADKPPTEKQIAFLRSLGYSGVPMNRLEASKLIDQRINSRNYLTQTPDGKISNITETQ